MMVCGVDPAPKGFHYAVLDASARHVCEHGYVPIDNLSLRVAQEMALLSERVIIERIRSYGMPASAATFDTQWNAARLFQAIKPMKRGWLYRTDVKLHLLGTTAGNDAQVNKALYDRFGGDRKAAVGTKANKGPCYGVKGDEWAALAVAVAWWEREHQRML